MWGQPHRNIRLKSNVKSSPIESISNADPTGDNSVPKEATEGGLQMVIRTTPEGRVSTMEGKVSNNQSSTGKGKVKKSGKDQRVQSDSKTKKAPKLKVKGLLVKPKIKADKKPVKPVTPVKKAKKTRVVEAVSDLNSHAKGANWGYQHFF